MFSIYFELQHTVYYNCILFGVVCFHKNIAHGKVPKCALHTTLIFYEFIYKPKSNAARDLLTRFNFNRRVDRKSHAQ